MTIQNYAADYMLELLKKLYQQTNTPMPEAELNTIQRLIDEERTTADVLKGWIGAKKEASLKNPLIEQPNFRSSPLRVFHCYMTTDQSIAINTYTPITFETSLGDTSIFDFWNNDKSKIRIDRSQLNVNLDGKIAWEGNTTGDRIIKLYIYDASDVEISSTGISNVPTSNSAGFGLEQGFAYTEDIKSLFPNVAYMQLAVFQNGANPLKVETAVLSVKIA